MRTFLYSGSMNEDDVEAFYRINYNIVKNHTIYENLILPSIKDAVSFMFRECNIDKINTIPLSCYSISHIIRHNYCY